MNYALIKFNERMINTLKPLYKYMVGIFFRCIWNVFDLCNKIVNFVVETTEQTKHQKYNFAELSVWNYYLLFYIFIFWIKKKWYNSIFRYKSPKPAVGALHFYTSSERIARVASCIEPYFSLQIHANPSWLAVYRHLKCAATQLHSTAVNMMILT